MAEIITRIFSGYDLRLRNVNMRGEVVSGT